MVSIMKTFMECTIERLRKMRDDFGSTAKFAEATGVNPVTLGRWLSGERNPTVAEVGKIFDKYEITLNDPGIDIASFEMIPKVEARAGAGSSLVTENRVLGLYAFRRDFLNRIGLRAKNCVLFDVMGESMQPLIMDRDTILVDTSQTEILDGKIFLVTLGDELLVKRIQRTPKDLLLVSQNPDFTPIPVEAGEEGTFRVHGQVRWFGRVI